MVLEVDNIELNFKLKRLLNGIYIKAESGKVTAILGKNGSGKSSLFNIIFGNISPKYKLIRINKIPILKPLYKTKNIKYLPQHHFIPEAITINKAFKLFKLNWEDFILLFESFKAYKKIKIKELSGGERRVLETYLILKAKSKIVILDEPFSHIAPLYIKSIKTLIQQEKKLKTILISDHMHRHIIDCSDVIYLLKNGSTRQITSSEELVEQGYLSKDY